MTDKIEAVDPPIELTVFRDVYGGNPQRVSTTFRSAVSEYYAAFRPMPDDTKASKHSVPLMASCIFKDGADAERNDRGEVQRNDANVVSTTGIIFDFDGKFGTVHPIELEDDLSGVLYAWHTTFSHRHDKPCSRLWIPYARPFVGTTDELRTLQARVFIALLDILGVPGGIDPSCADLSRSYFVASAPREHMDVAEWSIMDGQPLDAYSLIERVDGITATNRVAAMRRKTKKTTQTAGVDLASPMIAAPAAMHPATGANVQLDTVPMAMTPVAEGVTTADLARVGEGGRNEQLYQDCKDAIRGTANLTMALTMVQRIVAGMSPPLPLAEVMTTFQSAVRSIEAETPTAVVPVAARPPMSGAEIMQVPEVERQWAWDDNFPLRTVAGLFGDGGTGKSLFILHYMVCRAARIPFVDGKVPAPGKSLFVSCEDDMDEIASRLRAICIALGVNPAVLNNEIYVWDRSGMPNSLMDWSSKSTSGTITSFYQELSEWIRSTGTNAVFLDTRDDFYSGNENDNNQIRQFANRTLAPLAKTHNACVVFLGHISASGMMAGGSGLSGGRAWRNATRTQLVMTYDSETKIITLERTKSNYAPKGVVATMRLKYPIFVPSSESFEADQLIEANRDSWLRRTVIDYTDAKQPLRFETKSKTTMSPAAEMIAAKAKAEKGTANYSPQEIQEAINKGIRGGWFVHIGCRNPEHSNENNPRSIWGDCFIDKESVTDDDIIWEYSALGFARDEYKQRENRRKAAERLEKKNASDAAIEAFGRVAKSDPIEPQKDYTDPDSGNE